MFEFVKEVTKDPSLIFITTRSEEEYKAAIMLPSYYLNLIVTSVRPVPTYFPQVHTPSVEESS